MRTASFDRDQVLRSAMQAFRHKGFAATTMQDLVAATGLHPGSIYCAFGNKKGLLLAAVDHYVADRQAALAACFEGVSPLAGLRRYLDQVVAEIQSCDSMACLLTKTLQELSEQDEEVSARLGTLLKDLERRLAQALAAAQQAGEARADATPEQLARLLLVGIYGLRTYAHVHPAPDCLQETADRLLAALRA
ncbi:TetR/AcrR family transcriptional regulator [Zobellella sp. An-6]|uniref:TetR/AcrR family transcriptional regulator n=1 Tax=Zobellella sp. An-6 TaxID=3400218 RepID=UPI0040410AAF